MIYVSLGANLSGRFGEPEEALRCACDALDEAGLRVVAASRIWFTAPVPISDQPWYRNAVVQVESPLSSLDILSVLQGIEQDFGRVRTVRNAPRTLDLDLIDCRGEIRYDESGYLILPHPRMAARAFVLLPLRDIASAWRHPVSGLGIDDLCACLPEEQEAEPGPFLREARE